MPFEFQQLAIPGLVLVEPKLFGDQRGGFAELYKESDFVEHGIVQHFVQDNWSLSVKDVVRGLHMQVAPRAQAKLVSVARGEIYDVAVDLREDSPTYKQWFGVTLTAAGHRMLYVPEGCAHGFCALTDEVEVAYKVTAEYDPALEIGIAWDDPEIGVKWPVQTPVLSERDKALPRLSELKLSGAR
jgi:dTDP-4-dehydrorhamnose 3,5-epimerase